MAEMKNENNAPLFVGQPSRKPGSCFFEQNTIFLIDMYSTYSLLTSLILFFLKKKIEQRVREEGYSGVGMRDAMDRRALFFGRQMIFVRGAGTFLLQRGILKVGRWDADYHAMSWKRRCRT
jgi:hypothetical protein